ncbi:MAG: glucose-6-phosphate dehydrogenase assembly protein OpcA [Myxococcota bacterium]
MTTPQNLDRFSRGEEIGVDVASIEREFAALWRAAGQTDERAPERKPVTRACLANLVTWVEEESTVPRVKEAFDTLVLSVPARVLVLRPEASAPGQKEFESWISANCILAPGGGKLVCSEEVTLVARGRGVEHFGPVVRALLVPNVPTMIYAADAPQRAFAALQPLLKLCDRLIVDTAEVVQGGQLKAISRLIPNAPSTVDLGWLTLASFRTTLASVFDTDEAVNALKTLSEVRLFAPKARMANRLLFLGWLSERLGWGPPKRCSTSEAVARGLPAQGSALLTVEAPHGPVFLRIDQVVPDEVEPQAPTILELVTKSGLVKLTRGRGAMLTVESFGQPPRVVALDPPSLGERIARGMGPRARDPIFDRAWPRALAMWEAVERP